MNRRSFLIALHASVGGLALGIVPRRARASDKGQAPRFTPGPLVAIAADGTVTITCHRSEMGQGIRSTLPVVIADELGADMARVVVHQADGDPRYGDQNTDGSSSIRGQLADLRAAGAAARMMLVAAAAKRWKVKPRDCVAAGHAVAHPRTRRKLDFADLVADAARQPVPTAKQIVLRPVAELRRVADPSLPLIDGEAYVTGAAVYGADVTLPGMKVAVIARPPVVGGKVARHKATRALAVPGVRQVVELPAAEKPWQLRPLGGIAVVADTTWAALKGRAALEIEWQPGDNASHHSAAFRDQLLASVRAPGTAHRNVGDVDAAFAKAARTVEAEYLVPHLAHLPMEPPAALARVADGRAEVWAPTQDPQTARSEVATALGIAEDRVTVHVTLLGGGFGRKSKPDFITEAALIASKVGAPVRVQWTREDDIRHGYYNAVSAQRLRAALDGAGAVTGWHHRTAFTPIASTFDASAETPGQGELGQGILDLPLAAPNVRAEACRAPAHARIGWYRSVYNIFHAFAIGSFVDEIAHAVGKDPLQTWLDVIGPARKHGIAELGVEKLRNYGGSLDDHPVDSGRLRRVLERVADAARWSQRGDRALGIAAHRSFLSYAGVVVSAVRDRAGKVRIDEAWIAIDAGTVVNQERVRAQLEGAVVMGISNALFGGITMQHGAVVEANFRDVRIARIGDAPRRIHTEIIQSSGPPGGVGEPGVPPVAAAVANALFALTGQRLREVPLARALARSST